MVSDKWLQENRGWYRVPIKDPTIQFLEGGSDFDVDFGWAVGWTRKKTVAYSPFTNPEASVARFIFVDKPVEDWRYMVIEVPDFSEPIGVSSKGAAVMAQGGRPSATAGIWTVAWDYYTMFYPYWDEEIKALVIDSEGYGKKDRSIPMKYWSSARSGPVFSTSTVKLYKVGPPGGEGDPFPLFDESEYETPEWGNRNPTPLPSAGPKYTDYGPIHSGGPVAGRNPPLKEEKVSDGSPTDTGLFDKVKNDDKDPLRENPRVSEKAKRPNSEVECVVEGYFDCKVGDHIIIPEDPLRRRFIVTEVEYEFMGGALMTHIRGSIDGDIRYTTATIITGVVNYLFGRR